MISGGTATLLGPIAGAAIVVVMKNVVSAYVERWNLVLGVIFFIRAFYYTTPPGWASLAVTILFVGGSILMVLGIIGEYISRIFTLNNERPQFSVKETLTSREQTKSAVR